MRLGGVLPSHPLNLMLKGTSPSHVTVFIVPWIELLCAYTGRSSTGNAPNNSSIHPVHQLFVYNQNGLGTAGFPAMLITSFSGARWSFSPLRHSMLPASFNELILLATSCRVMMTTSRFSSVSLPYFPRQAPHPAGEE